MVRIDGIYFFPSNSFLFISSSGYLKKFSVGGCHNIVLEDDSLISWGDNGVGQLGIGNNNNQNIPQKIPIISKIISISCGGFHTFY